MNYPAPQRTEPPALLDYPGLNGYIKIKRSQLYGLMREDKFPKPLKIGKSSRWVRSQVDAWIAEQVAAQQAILPPLELLEPVSAALTAPPAPAQPAKAKPPARRKQPKIGGKWSATAQAA